MSGSSWAWASLLLLCSACTRSEPAQKVQGVAARSVDAQPGAEQAAPPEAAPAKGPLTVRLEVERSAQGAGLHVLSLGPEPVELAQDVRVRRKEGGAEREALRLRLSCAQSGCVKLAPGSELVAPSWLGVPEGERCDALYRPEQPGQYVLTVRSCDGARTAETSFLWPP